MLKYMFPNENRFGALFRRLLPVGMAFGSFFFIAFVAAVLFGDEPPTWNDKPLAPAWGIILALIFAPMCAIAVAFAGAINLYFGRRIPLIKRFLPRYDKAAGKFIGM